VVEQRFSEMIKNERERLQREREKIFDRQRELENKLADLARELEGVDAYDAAKTGKQSTGANTRSTGNGRQERRGSRRNALLELIGDNPDGLTRSEILERMGLKGDKSGEMSVSNALTALTKRNQLSRMGGKYRTA
jgi:hypothetical protein